MTSNWIIREAKASDLNFIYSTWLNSYRSGSRIGGSTRKTVFFKEYYGVVDFILSKKETKVFVACLPEEKEVILAYAVIEPGIAHYFFTKESFREMGIARSLWTHAFGVEPRAWRAPLTAHPIFTHRTKSIEPILSKYDRLLYNPFELFSRLKPNQNGVENG